MKLKIKALNQRLIVYILVSVILTVIYFYTTREIIFSLVLALILMLFFFLLIEKEHKKYKKIDKRTHECVAFINNFIITLSISNSIVTTFETLKDGLKGELKEEVDNLEHLTVEEKLIELKSYFNLSIYDFFVKIVNQYIYNGGDILQISQLLIYDSRRIENSLDNHKVVSRRKFIEFSSLWGITLLILVIIQISLQLFYDSILKMSFYAPSIFAFFLLLLVFLYLFLKQTFNLSFINQWRESINEKLEKKD